MSEQILRVVRQRASLVIATAATCATVCGATDVHTADRSADAVELVAAIDESPTTVGLADSNLVRLGTEDLINEQLDMMQALGVQNVRIGISWISTQLSENGNFFWGATDYVVDEAHRRGMGVLGVLHETPAWAGSPPLSGMPNLDAFANFAGAVAEKYEGKISALEVWNEPNGKFFLNPVSPSNYAAMVQAAYTAIKAHDDPDDPDDDITVIAGVLGSGRSVGDDFTMNPVDFLQGMYDAGVHGYFDAFSFHPYHYDIPFSEGAQQSDSPILQLRELRALMEQYGDGDLKVWASEYGLPTTPFDIQHPLLYNSPEKQAEFLADFLDSWHREDGTGPIFIYSTRDLNTGSPSDQDNFGIWYTDWQEKPAVQVIRDYLDELEPDHPIVEAIRKAINRIADITATVINDIVDAVVAVVDVVVDVTVWAVQTIAQVTVNVVKGIADLTSRVVHGIADAISTSVNWVVDKVRSCLGRGDSTSQAQTSTIGPTAAAAAEPDITLDAASSEHPAATATSESPTNEPRTGAAPLSTEQSDSAEVAVLDPTAEPAPAEGGVPDSPSDEAAEVPVTELDTDAAEVEVDTDEVETAQVDTDEAHTDEVETDEIAAAPVTPRKTARTARTAERTGPRTAGPN